MNFLQLFLTRTFLISIALLIIGLVLGYFIGNRFPNLNSDVLKQEYFFDNQYAYLSGKITKINGSTITVENKKGQRLDVNLADEIIIFNGEGPNLLTQTSNSRDKLITNKDVNIVFSNFEGTLKASQFNYSNGAAIPSVDKIPNSNQIKSPGPLAKPVGGAVDTIKIASDAAKLAPSQ